jgi:predicted P-loop ATPase
MGLIHFLQTQLQLIHFIFMLLAEVQVAEETAQITLVALEVLAAAAAVTLANQYLLVDQELQVKEVQVDRVPRLEILLAVAVAVQVVLVQMV